METIGKIRRRHLIGGESISAVARSLNLSRNTVKKNLAAEDSPAYQRQQQPSAFQLLLEQWLEHDRALPKAAA